MQFARSLLSALAGSNRERPCLAAVLATKVARANYQKSDATRPSSARGRHLSTL